MARINKKAETNLRTAMGAKAKLVNPELQLRRSVMACMLWEDAFYEDGVSVVDRIADLVTKVDPEKVAEIAIEAREKFKLRHVPLLLARVLAKNKYKKLDTLLERIIQRPDELTEFLSIYWMDGKQPLSHKVKLGLAKAFTKFDEYQLAKYNRDDEIKLRDVLFLCHAKPKDETQEKLWKKLVDKTLAVPDTWEVALSAGNDKKTSWERLLKEKKLGGLALLRNLRNMEQAAVDKNLVKDALANMKTDRILPFRFISAAKHAPKLEPELEQAMYRSISTQEKLKGKTILIVDTSGSMYGGMVSRKSDLSRVDAAGALAILIREICEDPVLYATAGNDGTRIHATTEIPARRGFALSSIITKDQLHGKIGGGGIFLTQVMDFVYDKEKSADRVIVITDEQDCDNDDARSPLKANTFGKQNYLINISVEKNGIGYDKWVHIDGWSEAVVQFIQEYERQ